MHQGIRVGLVGVGEMGRTHLPHLIARGGPVYVHASSRADDVVATHGGTAVNDYEELLGLVDVVDVAVPTPAHAELIERALRAGKDVITEKPLARTDAEAARIAALAAELGRTVFPAHVSRYFPEYRALEQSVARGDLGALAVLRFSRSGPYPMRSPWFRDRALSGGVIGDLMIHDLDVARWVAGEVVKVSAVASSLPDAEAPMEAAHVILTHASGAISQISGVWGPQHIDFTTEFSVAGTLGTLAHSSAAQRDYRADLVGPTEGVATAPAVDPAADPYAAELDDFLTALETGSTPRVSLDDGVHAVRLVTAALESVDRGAPVRLNPASAMGGAA
jgi:predicted dehydrogenase